MKLKSFGSLPLVPATSTWFRATRGSVGFGAERGGGLGAERPAAVAGEEAERTATAGAKAKRDGGGRAADPCG